MQILHLAVDDKFTPFAVKVFESVFPGNNQFRVKVAKAGQGRCVQASAGVELVTRRYWFDGRLDRDLRGADLLVVHFMTPWSAKAILRAPASLPIAWHGWGGDYYPLLQSHSGRLFLPSTAEWVASQGAGIGEPLRMLASRLRDWTAGVWFGDWREKALARVDVVSMMPEEYEELARTRPGMKAKFHQLYCSSAEGSYLDASEPMSGDDILLGNSATPSNNHLEALALLEAIGIEGRRILVPLSYGDRDYADMVCHQGRRLFGSDFIPLLDFMPPADYARRIAGCGYVLMNHVRQQGTGVVTMALARGAKVFLRSDNLLLKFYRRLGAHICEMPGSTGGETPFSPLSIEQAGVNRRVVADYWALDTILAQARRLPDVAGVANA